MPRHSGMTSRITLDDIATATGVSRATVSKALNDRKDVSAETRLLIRRTADDLGYGSRTSASTVRNLSTWVGQ